MKRTYYGIIVLSLLALASCKVGPDYHPPKLNTPDKWISGAADSQGVIEQEWWKNFHDSTLDMFISKALKDNLDLKIAETRIAQARAMRSIAGNDLLPTVNMTGGVERQSNRIAFGGGAPFDLTKPFNTFQAGFDASWELDLFGGKRRALESATAEVKAAEALRDSAKVSLLAEVARTYVAVRQYQAQVRIAEDMVTANQKTLGLAKERYHAGVVPRLDVTQAEALLTSSQAQLPFYQNNITGNEYSMDVLLGEQPGYTHSKMTSPESIPVADNGLALAAPAKVIANRPDIRAAEYKLASATAEQGVVTAALFPDISLSGFFGLLSSNSSTFLNSSSKSWDGAGNLVWSILNYGKLSANIHAANAREQEALAEYQKSVITALADVERSLTSLEKQQKQRDFLNATVKENGHAAEIARERYKAGLTTFLEVLDADRTFFVSQTQALDGDANLTQDQIALYKSLGGGWKTGVTIISSKQ
jgi:NodT family efflux transporter outer membrane factor (OMF) lipoprotein